MARIAGIAYLKVNGGALPLKANCVVSPDGVERAMIAGQDAVHGYSENPRAPWIQADISLTPEVDMEDLTAGVDEVVTVEFADGAVYALQHAVSKAATEHQTKDGQVTVRWEGTNCIKVA